MAIGHPAAAFDCSPTEAFLLRQEEVLDASCSSHRQKLVATVQVASESTLTPGKLMEACRKGLRPEYRPALIVFVQAEVDCDEAVA